MAVETVEYRVRRGDSLQTIVQAAGFPRRDWRRIYDAAYNRAFRSQRPDPDSIAPGDRLMLPRYNPAEIVDIGRRIQMVERRFGLLDEARNVLRQTLAALERQIDEAEDLMDRDLQRRVANMLTEADEVMERSRDIADECSDTSSCLGAGAYAGRLTLEARRLRQEASTLQRHMKKDEVAARKALKKIQQCFQVYVRAQRDTEREITRLRGLYRSASQRPY